MKFLLTVDGNGPLRFAPLGGETALSILGNAPDLAKVDSIVLAHRGRLFVRSTAVLEILRYLGGLWRIFLIGFLIPREIRDSLYDVIAYWRYRLFGRSDVCPLPPPEARPRFLP